VKGEAAASVRAQRCQSHYFSTTPRTGSSIHLLIFCFWSTCELTYASFYHWEQHFSLRCLTSMLLLPNCLFENEWSCIFNENNGKSPKLSRAVLEGDQTRRTMWTQAILMEQWQNGNMRHSVNRPLCSPTLYSQPRHSTTVCSLQFVALHQGWL
jgi:hypothetical protein